MGEIFILFLYIVFAFILGILAFILKKKHSKFPDFRVGYHNKKVMRSAETWKYANNVAGNLCALFAAIGVLVYAILYFVQTDLSTTIITFFLYAVTAILVILIAPVQISKRKYG